METGWFQVEWRLTNSDPWRDGARPPTFEMAQSIEARWKEQGYLTQVVHCRVIRTVM